MYKHIRRIAEGHEHNVFHRITQITSLSLFDYIVLEAKLVSSCFSLPSRAKPLFALLLPSRGVRVYTWQEVELGETWSLRKM